MPSTLLQAVALLAALVALARWATAPRPSHADAEAALLRGGFGQSVLRSPTLLRVAGPLAARAAAALDRAAARFAPPAATLLVRINGGLSLAIAAAAVDLGLADAVAGAPHPPTAADLATALALTDAAAPDRVHRFLRAAAAVGLFHPVPSRRTPDTPHTTRWRNTRASAALRAGHATPMLNMVALAGVLAREAWPHLADAVRAPGDGFAAAHGGTPFFPWLAANPRADTVFHAAMAETGFMSAAIVAATLKGVARAGPLFRPPRRVVDVGGGTGSFLRALLRATPATTTGVLFDLPRVARAAPKSARVDVVGGSFFRAADLPPLAAGDAVTLRCILHDWSDDAAADILRALRAAVGRGVRAGVAPDPAPVAVAIIDAAVPLRGARSDPWKTGCMDANMLATVCGRERSVPEVARLLREAGWAPVADVAAVGPMRVVVGVAV